MEVVAPRGPLARLYRTPLPRRYLAEGFVRGYYTGGPICPRRHTCFRYCFPNLYRPPGCYYTVARLSLGGRRFRNIAELPG